MSKWNPKVRITDPKTREPVTVRLTVDVDWEAIAEKLARQALKSKRRRSTLLNGAMKARIVNVT